MWILRRKIEKRAQSLGVKECMPMRKGAWLVLSIVLLVAGSIIAHFAIFKKQTYNVDEYNPELFGVGEPITLRHIFENLDIQQSVKALRLLGVTRLREWTWMGALLINQTALNQTFKETLDRVISEMAANNITVMGMAHDFPRWMTGIDDDPQAIPYRNMTKGSAYMKFLERYRESWKTLARAFPYITMWEIGNEFNTDMFLHPQDFPESNFSIQEKAEIMTDLLYYASLGIHEGNPNAKTVLGGLASTPNITGIADFLDLIYTNIKSGRWPSRDPDDYFQIVCWHPYLPGEEPTESNWVTPQLKIHEVMERYGDGDKPVVFSEFGYSDQRTSHENISKYLLKAFQLAKRNFPWLKTIYWFRLVDPEPATVSAGNPPGYGLIKLNWTWKPAARTYRSLIRIEAGLHYVNTLWMGYAFYETLDLRASDYKRIYKDTNYLAARTLLMIDREIDKVQKVAEWLSGYKSERWRLLFGEDPEDPTILMQYANSPYADQRALLGIYYSYGRNITLAISELNWIKERFDGEKILDEAWIRQSYYEPYKLALASILAHRMNDYEFKEKLLQSLLKMQILNPPTDKSFNYGGFPGTLKPSEDPDSLIPNLETTILSILALNETAFEEETIIKLPRKPPH